MKLRGLCPDSNIESHWVTDTDKALFIMYGTVGSEISYDMDSNGWKLRVFSRKEKTLATSLSSYHSFIMGKSQWSVVNDTKG